MEAVLDGGLTPDDYNFYYSHINSIANDSDSTFLQADAERSRSTMTFSKALKPGSSIAITTRARAG